LSTAPSTATIALIMKTISFRQMIDAHYIICMFQNLCMSLKTSFLIVANNSTSLRLTISDMQILHLSDEPLSLLLNLFAQRALLLSNRNRSYCAIAA
jgi:hypothetical protein